MEKFDKLSLNQVFKSNMTIAFLLCHDKATPAVFFTETHALVMGKHQASVTGRRPAGALACAPGSRGHGGQEKTKKPRN